MVATMAQKKTGSRGGGAGAGAGGEGRSEYEVPPDLFIRTWQTSDTADEVAEKLGMPRDIVHARAANYRKAGVKLKKLSRSGNRGLDVEALNELIRELDREDAEANAGANSSGVEESLVEEVTREVIQRLRRRK